MRAKKIVPAQPKALPLLDTLLDAAVEMRQNPDDVERFYMARQLVQCTLPHSDPGDVTVWTRTNGKLTLAIRPYVDLKTRETLYPYGTIPRLLLFFHVQFVIFHVDSFCQDLYGEYGSAQTR